MHRKCTDLVKLQQSFVELVLPAIKGHGRPYFRALGYRAEKLAEALQEARGLAWWSWLSSANARKHPQALAVFSCRRVASGRKLVSPRGCNLEGNGHARDIGRVSLRDFVSYRDNPADVAAFSLDVPAWLATLPTRYRAIADLLIWQPDARGKDIARKFGVSQGRVSQIRRALREDYERFTTA